MSVDCSFFDQIVPSRRFIVASSLEHLTLLLVEDNVYIRRILETCLRQLGFTRIFLASNGEEAIDMIKAAQDAPGRAISGKSLVPAFDMILADYLMSPIDGLLLLRWLRQDKDSPNRLVPFMMVSGAADYDVVNAARDAGVSEFLAKPFSVQSLYDRLRRLIDMPRPFICCQNYFGPDRRRRSGEPPRGIKERRRFGDEHVTYVYSPDVIKKPRNPSDVWIFRLPNALKAKLGTGSMAAFVLPPEILQQAENELQRQSLDFRDWAVDYLRQISDVLNAVEDKPVPLRRGDFSEMNMLAHELRGQGSTFGYPLMTVLAKSLYEASRAGSPYDDAQVSILKAHVDAMRVVLRDGIIGDGGMLGRDLLLALDRAISVHRKAAGRGD